MFRQLLNDCGIGVEETAGQGVGETPVVNQHRVLLFCQLKGMLDIVEQDLLKYAFLKRLIEFDNDKL